MTQNSSEKSGVTLREVCLIAQDLYRGIAEKCNVQPPIKVKEWLVPAIAQKAGGTGYKIEILAKEWPQKHLCGKVCKYSDKSVIMYSIDMNPCWKRFVIAKELAHVCFDNNASYTTDPVAMVQGLINVEPNCDPGLDIHSEYLAYYGAIELMLPWCLRPQVTEMARCGHSHNKIAQTFRVPEKVITYALTTKYWENSTKANREVAGS